ncbi:MAG: hypothetical protein RLZZ200_656 [Pseudomonadota bacterium]|jgi:hypothetical protein
MIHGATVNVWALLVAALCGFVIGGLWYGPLFQKRWMAASGMSFEKGRQQNIPLVFGLTYLLNVAIAFGIAILAGDVHGALWTAHAGFFASLIFIAPALGVIYLFESRPLSLWLINTGYQVVNATVMGAVLGAWPH